MNLAGIPLAEHAALENIRDFLGHSSTLRVTRWRPGTRAVLTELPRTSRVAAGTDLAAWEAAHPGRRQAHAPWEVHDRTPPLAHRTTVRAGNPAQAPGRAGQPRNDSGQGPPLFAGH